MKKIVLVVVLLCCLQIVTRPVLKACKTTKLWAVVQTRAVFGLGNGALPGFIPRDLRVDAKRLPVIGVSWIPGHYFFQTKRDSDPCALGLICQERSRRYS